MLPQCMSANSQTRSARREGKNREEREGREEKGCLNSLAQITWEGRRERERERNGEGERVSEQKRERER